MFYIFRWVERNAGALLKHLLVDVLSNPKAVSSHIEAVHSRRYVSTYSGYKFMIILDITSSKGQYHLIHLFKLSFRCINHVIKVIFGRLLGENAQLAACKEMTLLIFR